MTNKNKESRLEKGAGIVATIRKKYKWHDLIPFGFMSKKIRDSWGDENGKITDSGSKKLLINWSLSLIFALAPFLYGADSLLHGSLNYKKWPEIQNQRKLKQELINQNYYRKQFQEIDKNKDCVLDSTEFYNFYKEKK